MAANSGSNSRDELIARAQLAELLSEPGLIEEYSNLGYQLLAAIFELTTGQTYPDLLRRYIYQPAGMTGTDFWFVDNAARDFADGCRSGDVHWGNPIDDAMWGASGPSWNLIRAGGLLSTADSLGRLFEGIGDGVYFDTPQQLNKYKQNRMVFSNSGQQLIMGPAGSNGIFNAVAAWIDDDRLNVIMMTNRADHTAEGAFTRILSDCFQPAVFRHVAAANRDIASTGICAFCVL